jgi:hypothetical protein
MVLHIPRYTLHNQLMMFMAPTCLSLNMYPATYVTTTTSVCLPIHQPTFAIVRHDHIVGG